MVYPLIGFQPSKVVQDFATIHCSYLVFVFEPNFDNDFFGQQDAVELVEHLPNMASSGMPTKRGSGVLTEQCQSIQLYIYIIVYIYNIIIYIIIYKSILRS